MEATFSLESLMPNFVSEDDSSSVPESSQEELKSNDVAIDIAPTTEEEEEQGDVDMNVVADIQAQVQSLVTDCNENDQGVNLKFENQPASVPLICLTNVASSIQNFLKDMISKNEFYQFKKSISDCDQAYLKEMVNGVRSKRVDPAAVGVSRVWLTGCQTSIVASMIDVEFNFAKHHEIPVDSSILTGSDVSDGNNIIFENIPRVANTSCVLIPELTLDYTKDFLEDPNLEFQPISSFFSNSNLTQYIDSIFRDSFNVFMYTPSEGDLELLASSTNANDIIYQTCQTIILNSMNQSFSNTNIHSGMINIGYNLPELSQETLLLIEQIKEETNFINQWNQEQNSYDDYSSEIGGDYYYRKVKVSTVAAGGNDKSKTHQTKSKRERLKETREHIKNKIQNNKTKASSSSEQESSQNPLAEVVQEDVCVIREFDVERISLIHKKLNFMLTDVLSAGCVYDGKSFCQVPLIRSKLNSQVVIDQLKRNDNQCVLLYYSYSLVSQRKPTEDDCPIDAETGLCSMTIENAQKLFDQHLQVKLGNQYVNVVNPLQFVFCAQIRFASESASSAYIYKLRIENQGEDSKFIDSLNDYLFENLKLMKSQTPNLFDE
jgi:hypothetical protein